MTVAMVMGMVLAVMVAVFMSVFCCHCQSSYTGTGKRFTGARLSVCQVTEVMRGLYLSLFGIRAAEQESPALWPGNSEGFKNRIS